MALNLVLLVGAGPVLSLLTYLASRWFLWGAFLLMLCAAKQAPTHEFSPLAGKVFLEDCVAAALLAAALLRVVVFPALSGRKMPGGVLFALLCFSGFLLAIIQSFVRGFWTTMPVTLYGLHMLLLYAGGVCYGLSWFRTPPATLLRQLGKAYLFPAVLVVLVVVLRWTIDPQLLALPDRQVGTFRVVGASEALLILEALLVGLAPRFLKGGRVRLRHLLSVGAGGVLLVFLGHRSVWAATMAAVLWWAWVSKRRALLVGAIALTLTVTAAWILPGTKEDTATSSPGLRPYLARQASEPFGETSTLRWRYEGWESIMQIRAKSGPVNALLGAPFGTDYYYAAGMTHAASPHNWYVTVLAYFGLVGMALWIPLFLMGLLNLKCPDPERRVFGAVCMVCGIFYVAYSVCVTHGLLLGLACAAYAGAPSSRRERLKNADIRFAHLPQPTR